MRSGEYGIRGDYQRREEASFFMAADGVRPTQLAERRWPWPTRFKFLRRGLGRGSQRRLRHAGRTGLPPQAMSRTSVVGRPLERARMPHHGQPTTVAVVSTRSTARRAPRRPPAA